MFNDGGFEILHIERAIGLATGLKRDVLAAAAVFINIPGVDTLSRYTGTEDLVFKIRKNLFETLTFVARKSPPSRNARFASRSPRSSSRSSRWGSTWRESARAIAAIDLRYLALVLALVAIDRAVMILRWVLLLRASGIAITTGDATRLFLVSSFVGSFLPAGVGADAARAYGLARGTRHEARRRPSAPRRARRSRRWPSIACSACSRSS